MKTSCSLEFDISDSDLTQVATSIKKYLQSKDSIIAYGILRESGINCLWR